MNLKTVCLLIAFVSILKCADGQIISRMDSGEWQLLDETTRKPMLDMVFDDFSSVSTSDNALYRVKKGSDVYVINARKGTISAPYQEIIFMGGYFKVRKGNQVGTMDMDLKESISCNFRELTPIDFGGNYFLIARNESYGLFDTKGNQILDTVYLWIESKDDVLIFKSQDGEYGFVGAKGKVIAGLDQMTSYYYPGQKGWMYCRFENRHDALLHVPSEKLVDMPEGHYLYRASQVEGLPPYFMVEKNKKIGLMDQEGKMVLAPDSYSYSSNSDSPLQYLSGEDHSLALLNNNGKLELRQVQDLKIVQRGSPGNGDIYLYGMKENDAYSLVDKRLKVIGDRRYKNLYEGTHAVIAKNPDGKYGLISATGAELIPFIYDGFDPYVWQFTALKKDGEIYLFNADNQRVFANMKINKVDHYFSDIAENYMVLQTGATKSLVSINDGKVILDTILDIEFSEDIYYMNDLGLAIVRTRGGKGLFSIPQSKFLIQPVYEEIKMLPYYSTESHLLQVKKAGKFNLYDPRSQQFLLTGDADKIIGDADAEIWKAISGNKLYLIAGEYNDQKMRVIQTDILYKNARFSYDYDALMENNSEISIRVKNGKKIGLLRLDGSWVHKPELDSYEPFLYNAKYLLVVKGKLTYIIRLDGSYVTDKGFDMVEFMGEEPIIALGYLKGEEFTISEKGEVKLKMVTE